MGANIIEAQQVVEREAPPFPTGTYPGKAKRLEAIRSGWEKADIQNENEKGIAKRRKRKKSGLIAIAEKQQQEPMFEYESSMYMDGRPNNHSEVDIYNKPPRQLSLPDGLEGYELAVNDLLSNNVNIVRGGNSKVSVTINGRTISSSNTNSVVVGGSSYSSNGSTYIYQNTPVDRSAYITQELSLAAINSIRLELPIIVEMTQGKQHIEIEGPEEIISQINKNVSNGAWRIGANKPGDYNMFGVKIRITLPTVKSLDIKGTGTIISKGQTFRDINRVIFKINGTGDINFSLLANTVICKINGTGDINLRGKANHQQIDLRGTGDIHCGNLIVKSCTVSMNGTGSSRVNASDFIDGSLNGSADLYYRGRPIIKINNYGNGSIKPY